MLIEDNATAAEPQKEMNAAIIDCVDIALSQMPESFEVKDTGAGLAEFWTMIQKYDCGMSETEVRAYYAHMRAAEEQRAERVTERLESSAEYRAAAQEISALSMQLAKAEYIRADAFEIVRLKKQLDAAKEKRRAAMTRLGIKPGEEKKRMFCTKCGDTGYLSGGKQCVCVAANEEAIRAYAAGVRKCKAAT